MDSPKPITLPPPEEIRRRIEARRAEIRALQRLHRMSRDAQHAETLALSADADRERGRDAGR
jgi:hypothetical protein